MSFQCHFVSFGAGRKGYGSALKRLRREIERLDPDACVWLFDESSVGDEIEGLDLSFSDFATTHPRGYGLWVWKPWLILEVMKKARDSDVVFYLDAGCTVHSSSLSRDQFEKYLFHLRNQGFLFFQLDLPEYEWTKRDVFKHFDMDDPDVSSGQVLAGIQGYLVNSESRRFVREWLYACTLDSGRLLWDENLDHNEDHRFIEHRHDQSVLSCLVKRKAILTIPDETFHFPKWNKDGDKFPFWATRKMSGLPSWMGYYAPLAVIRGRLIRIRNWIVIRFSPKRGTNSTIHTKQFLGKSK
jgi:hypothetical protein